MNWLKFKADDIKNDETKFIVGIDLGNSNACLAYYDFNLKKTQVFDISGGYSKASIPVVVQYVPENDEWIFGEYAVLNRPMGNDIIFKDIIKNMGRGLTFQLGEKTVSLCYVLSLFIKEIIGSIKNINPKAEICAIVASIAPYITDEAKNEIKNAFFMAGYEDSFIGFRDERQCIINYYFENKKEMKDKLLILDYGERSFRGNLFSLNEDDKKITAKCELSLFDTESGTGIIEEKLEALFKNGFLEASDKSEITEDEKKEIAVFTYEHKDLFLQRSNSLGIKLYYNFCYPPVKKNISKDEIENFIKPFETRLYEFLSTFKNEDCAVLTAGGGFDQIWAKNAVAEIFKSQDTFKIGKEISACGACIIACGELGIIKEFKKSEIEDRQQIKDEIGVIVNENEFIPLSEKNTFWWQEQKKRFFIVDNNADNNFNLEIFKRSNSDVVKISELDLKAVKKEKNKITRMRMQVKYESCDNAYIEICDMGFGEIEKSSGFKEKFAISL